MILRAALAQYRAVQQWLAAFAEARAEARQVYALKSHHLILA